MLPAAVQAKVDKAAALSKGAADRQAGVTHNGGAPTPDVDVVKLQADLKAAKEAEEKARAELATANNRYGTLRGKYDAEVPALNERLRAAEAARKEAEEQVNRKIEAGTLSSLSQDERTLAGPLLDVIAKSAREVAEQTVDARMKPLNERFDKFERQSDAAYLATLDAALPRGWDDPVSGVNEDPNFLNWLRQLDPQSQRTRWDLLKRAEAARQGHQVAEIFLAFLQKREIGVREAPPAQPTPKVDPLPSGGGDQPALEEGAKRIWTGAEITAFYADKRSGKYKGKDGEEKARAIETEIFAARAENRIRR